MKLKLYKVAVIFLLAMLSSTQAAQDGSKSEFMDTAQVVVKTLALPAGACVLSSVAATTPLMYFNYALKTRIAFGVYWLTGEPEHLLLAQNAQMHARLALLAFITSTIGACYLTYKMINYEPYVNDNKGS